MSGVPRLRERRLWPWFCLSEATTEGSAAKAQVLTEDLRRRHYELGVEARIERRRLVAGLDELADVI
jgi:hypothetical protein